MNILVTGGTVFVSRYTAEYFVKKGHCVYVLNRGTHPQSEGVIHINGDRHALGDTLKAYTFDAVFDVTAYNEKDVSDLVEALGDIRQYVLVSSSAVYPETRPQPFKEDMPCGENRYWGAYGTDKIAAEAYLLAHVSQAYIIRPPYLYGQMNNVYREGFVFECAENDRAFFIPKNGEMPLQFFHIDDMCRFMEILLEKRPEQRVFNVGNPQTVSINEWVTLCYRVLDKEPQMVYIDGTVEQRQYFPFYDYGYVLNVTDMLALMSDVKPLDIGLQESYEWYREHRELVRRKPLMDYIETYLKK